MARQAATGRTGGLNSTTKHGLKHTPEWLAWKNMRQRCLNKNHSQYGDYGGRGIIICDRWDSFVNFYTDMGVKPSRSHSIDRIDNDGDYEPSNCRWTTKTVQVINRRPAKNNSSGIVGVSFYKSKAKWQAAIKVDGTSMHLGYFEDVDDAKNARKNAEQRYFAPVLKEAIV